MKTASFLIFLTILCITGCRRTDPELAENIIVKNDSLEIDLYTPHIVNTIPPGQEKYAFLRIHNRLPERQMMNIAFIFSDFDDDSLTIHQDVRIKPGDSTLLRFPDEIFIKKGIKWVSMSLETNSSKGVYDFSLACMDPIGNDYQSKFNFGIAGIRYNSEEELHWLYNAAEQVGVQYERKYASWGQIQPDAHTWNWEKLDRELAILKEHNLSRELLLNGTANWASRKKYADHKNKGNTPPRIGPWRKYVHAIAERYNGQVDYIEIWNEPDIGFFTGTTEEYLEMLKSAWQEIKSVNPGIRVLSGGFAQAAPRQNIFKERGDLHKDAVRLGQDYFDIHAFHRHGPFAVFKYEVDGPLKDIRAQLKSPKPMWFNETAMHSTSIGEKEQAKILFQKLSFAMARDAMGYNWFSLKNNTHAPITSAERHYGMITGRNSPKAVYLVYNQMVKNLYDKTFLHEIDLGEGFEAFLYTNGSDYLINAWKQDGSIPDQLAVFEADNNCRVMVSDLMGNEKEYRVKEGKVIVPIRSGGSFIKFLHCDKQPAAGSPLFAVHRIIVANEKDEVSVPVNLRTGILRSPKLTVIDGPAVAGTLNNSATGYLKVQSRNDLLTLKIEDKTYGLSEKLSIPVTSPLVIDMKNREETKAPINLDTYDHIVNKFEHDPNTGYLTWKGKDDLSVRSWVRLTGEYLSLRFDVTDDVHYQTTTGRSQSKGDDVHFALQVPGMLGFWDAGMALTNEGTSGIYIWSSPKGFDSNTVKVKDLHIERDPPHTRYELKLPLKDFGLSGLKEKGMNFTFLVNDNDGERHEGWIQYTPGLGGGKDLNKFKYVVFED